MKNKLFHIITGMFIASFFCGCENSDAEDSQLEPVSYTHLTLPTIA